MVPQCHAKIIMDEEKKLRYSKHRELIYEYILSSQEHPSAQMVYDALRSKIQGLSLGTVYRNLRLLEDLGKIRRVASHNGIERYDSYENDHVHFQCQNCGHIENVSEIDMEKIREVASLGSNYRLIELDLTLIGLCPRCTTQIMEE